MFKNTMSLMLSNLLADMDKIRERQTRQEELLKSISTKAQRESFDIKFKLALSDCNPAYKYVVRERSKDVRKSVSSFTVVDKYVKYQVDKFYTDYPAAKPTK